METKPAVETKPSKKRLPFRSMLSNRSAATRRRAGIRGLNVPKLPFKGTLTYACSRLPRGKFHFIECARLSDDPLVLSLVTRWDTLSHYDKRRISIEELCEAVGLAPGKLLGKVAEAMYEFNADVSNLLAAVMHPDVVQASINRALQPQGVEDRKIQFLHSGFLPVPRGSVVNVHAQAAAAVYRSTDEKTENTPLPDFFGGQTIDDLFEEQTIEASKVVREALESADSAPSHPSMKS